MKYILSSLLPNVFFYKFTNMKKPLIILFLLPFLFNSCEKDKTSSLCGTATLTVDGVSYTYNNPLPSTTSDPMFCLFSNVTIYNGEITGVTAQVLNYCSNNNLEWRVSGQLFGGAIENININQNYNSDPSFGGIKLQGAYDDESCAIIGNSYTNVQQGIQNGSFKLISIDYTNETISGEFSFTAYPINGGASKTISCVFNELPAQILSL